eukprot:4875677-Alexandrium_andersonii.AAC.1
MQYRIDTKSNPRAAGRTPPRARQENANDLPDHGDTDNPKHNCHPAECRTTHPTPGSHRGRRPAGCPARQPPP